MPFHVMDAEQRDVARERERLAVAYADEQRANESGGVRDGDRIQIIERRPGFFDRALDDRYDARQVRTRGNLRDDSSEHAMNVLRENHQRFLGDVVALSLEDRRR